MDNIHESNQVFINAWKVFAQRMPSGTVERTDGVVATLANVELPFLNICFHDGPLSSVEEVRARIQAAKKLAQGCPYPWVFILCEDWAPEGWESAVEQEDLVPLLTAFGMATDQLKPPSRPPPDLEFRRVQDETTARDLAELNGLAHGTPLFMIECMCNLYLWTDDAYGYVGYVDGSPVTCSAVFPVDNTLYVGFVATHPDHGRKGYGEAATRYSVEKAMDGTGLSRTTLHATEAGRPVYAAMGYEGETRFHMISEPLPAE